LVAVIDPDDLESYVRLALQLADAEADRAALLAAAGLDEAAWEAFEQAWLERLSAAEEAHGDADGVPALVLAHAETWARVQRERAAGVALPFERYVEITRLLGAGRDVGQVLPRYGLDLASYLQAHRYWTERMAVDRELAHRFRRS
jgi:hypothetical protein